MVGVAGVVHHRVVFDEHMDDNDENILMEIKKNGYFEAFEALIDSVEIFLPLRFYVK